MISNRTVFNNLTIRSQADFYEVDLFTRISGITFGDLVGLVFFDTVAQPWAVVDGTTVPDASITAGSLYLHEISGSAGYYALRFRPTGVGYWRVVLSYATVPQEVILDFDVQEAPGSNAAAGLKASFC